MGWGWVSAGVEKEKGIVSTELVGCFVRGVVASDVLVNQPCLDFETYSKEEPNPFEILSGNC